MASRPIVPQQQRGGAIVGGGGAKQKAGKAEVVNRNRKALGDIGNVQNRPITRSFCAQLLANAQEAAQGKHKNQVAQIVNGGGVPDLKVALKKVTVKAKPTEIIEISPDTVEQEVVKKETVVIRRMEKKSVHTLSSVLSARSKVACGLTGKPKNPIVDIDAADVDNQLAAVEYVEDIYKFYKLAEKSSRVHDYMDSQLEITEKMRAILFDWLVEVHSKFELMPETLYLTTHIVDRFLSLRSVSRKELQLVGISAMLIASKYEEIWAPEVNDFVCISDKAYNREHILVMEKRILGKLGWTLTLPTPYHFLVRFIKAAISDQEMENMVYFLAELGLMHYEIIIYCPSMVAASAVYAARCTLKKSPLWDETLEHHTGFSEEQVKDCAKLFMKFHTLAVDSENKLKGVYKKYSHPQRDSISLIPPAKTFLA